MDIVQDTIRHNSWSTRRLIEHLRTLSPEALELDAPGTYGQIGATLSHLLRAERVYLARLQAVAPQQTPPGRVDLEELADDARRLTEGWEEVLAGDLDPAASVQTIRGAQTAGTILAQVINHGAEHRAQICTVLGAHGLEPPAIDPFAYAEAANAPHPSPLPKGEREINAPHPQPLPGGEREINAPHPDPLPVGEREIK